MAPKVLVIFGATGQQGGAVAKIVLQDPQLRQQYHVRAAVRDPTKPSANTLRQLGCDIVQADLDDQASLGPALTGAHCAFLVTSSIFDDRLYEREYAQGKSVGDVAVEKGLDYLVFSTLPSVRMITANRYTKVWHFDVKYDIEQYIRNLPIRSSFVGLGAFMQNLTGMLKPKPVGDGTFEISTSIPPHTKLPMVDATDVAVFVGTILKDSDVFDGKVIYASSQLCRMDELAQAISETSGKAVQYKQLPVEVFRDFLEGLNPFFAEDFVEMAKYYEEFGYFGPHTEDLIQPSVNREFGKLTTLHDFVEYLEFESDSQTLPTRLTAGGESGDQA